MDSQLDAGAGEDIPLAGVIVYEDEFVRVVGEIDLGMEWFHWECKLCDAVEGGSASGNDRDMMIEDERVTGWGHVEDEMRQDREEPLQTFNIIRAWFRDQDLTSDE